MTLFEEIAKLEKENKKFALISIIGTKGSAPRNKGRMIIFPSGETSGTVGGGPAELTVTEAALECLKSGESKCVSYRLNRDNKKTSIDTLDMICGGDMDFFIEVFTPKPSLLLVGGGHVNHALSQLADLLNYPYIVADVRPGIISAERYPQAIARLSDPEATSSEGLINIAKEQGYIQEETALVIATHNHDKSALRGALNTEAHYIGMLGSRRKAKITIQAMEDEGFPPSSIARVSSPVGFDIGSETPEEIAVSIISEVMMRLNRSSGLLMSQKNREKKNPSAPLVIVRGAGDIATGTICRLHRIGFQVLALDLPSPTVIRRSISFAQALTTASLSMEIEGITATVVESYDDIKACFEEGHVAIASDPEGSWIEKLKPEALVDAILAKKNLGTTIDMAPTVVALGPGFSAGEDVHCVVETNRGHNLGKVILKGPAAANTGIPGTIAGYNKERVIHAPCSGVIDVKKDIESLVKKGDILAYIEGTVIKSPLTGVVRGMIAPGTNVKKGLKIADVDPRGDISYCHIVSDKARAIAGGVVEAILSRREL